MARTHRQLVSGEPLGAAPDYPLVHDDHPSRLGFAWACLVSSAIDMAEFRKWAELIIAKQDEPPLIFFDLVDFTDSKVQLYRLFRDRLVRGPWSGLTKQEAAALSGIAFLRDSNRFQNYPGEREACRQALDENRQVLDRFQQEFPFLLLSC